MRTRAHPLPAPEPKSRHLLWAGVVLGATLFAGFLALRFPPAFPDAERHAQSTFIGWLQKEKAATETRNVAATLIAASTGYWTNGTNSAPGYVDYRVQADFKTAKGWQRATGLVHLSGNATDLRQGLVQPATVRIEPLQKSDKIPATNSSNRPPENR